jgi:AcrR family transcriptional regulator
LSPTSETDVESPPTRERIREAALELFGEKGYDGTSMNELAERVGIAKPSLYNYYRSKEDLLLDLVEEGGRQWLAHCMAPFERAASLERQLAEHLRVVMEYSTARPHLVGVFHLATTHVHGELGERVDAVVHELETKIRAITGPRIAAAIAAGELDANSAEDVQIFLGVFFHGLLFQQTSCPHQIGPTQERLAQVWRFLFRGVSGREPKETFA